MVTARMALLPVLLFASLTSCNNNTSNESNESHADSTAITSCKMRLIRNYPAISANTAINFQLQPVAQPHDWIPALELNNGIKVNCIITSSDLSYFHHGYATKDSAGIYDITAMLPHAGEYLIIADYKAEGLPQQADSFHINVQGSTPKPVNYTSPRLICNVDGYTVQLLSKKLLPNTQAMVIMKIFKDGKPVLPETLQPYLGEETHMVCINTQTKEYLHAQSKSDPMSYWYLANFPKAGMYRVWIEFMSNNKVHLADFVIAVGG